MPLSKARDRKRKRLAKLNSIAEGFLPISACEICGWVGTVDVHHKDRDRQNGDMSNLQALCPNCHTAIHRDVFQPSSNLNSSKQFQPKSMLHNGYSAKQQAQSVPKLDADGQPIPDYW